jgi:hypothetical protein
MFKYKNSEAILVHKNGCIQLNVTKSFMRSSGEGIFTELGFRQPKDGSIVKAVVRVP